MTPEFKQEFKNIYTYISEVLLVRDTTKKIVMNNKNNIKLTFLEG